MTAFERLWLWSTDLHGTKRQGASHCFALEVAPRRTKPPAWQERSSSGALPGFHERPHVAEKAGPARVLDDFLKVAGESLGQRFGDFARSAIDPDQTAQVGTGDDRLSLLIGNRPYYSGQPTNNFLKANRPSEDRRDILLARILTTSLTNPLSSRPCSRFSGR
jgi:hypothetical protein